MVIAGQGTVGLELVEQLEDVETVVVPVGGGGLAAGIALGVEAVRADVRVVGVRTPPEGFAVADGIAVKQLGELPRAILDDRSTRWSRCRARRSRRRSCSASSGRSSSSRARALRAWPRCSRAGSRAHGPVAVVLSGGNVDATTLISVMRHGLTLAGRYLVVRTRVPDRPGELQKLLDLVTAERINVIDVEHRREGAPIAVGETEIWLTLATRDEEHCETLLAVMRGWGYDVERDRARRPQRLNSTVWFPRRSHS